MPRIARAPSHLYLKGNTYYFRYVIPKDVRKTFGLSEVRLSLGTGYLHEARPKARLLAVEVRRRVKKARSGELFESVKDMMQDFLRKMLAEHETEIKFGLDELVDTMRYEYGEAESKIESAREMLRSGDGAVLQGFGRQMVHSLNLVDFGLDADTMAPDVLREIGWESARMFVDYYEIIKHRAEGDFRYEKTILPDLEAAPQVIYQTAPERPRETPTVNEAIEQYKQSKIQDRRWTEVSSKDVMSTLSAFMEVMGDTRVGDVRREDMRSFKDVLLRLPKFRNTKKIYKNKSIDEILEMNPEDTLSEKTLNNILDNIAAFFSWCVQEQIIVSSPATNLQIKEEVRDDEHRSIYPKEDLLTIFHSPSYLEDRFRTSYSFWLPI